MVRFLPVLTLNLVLAAGAGTLLTGAPPRPAPSASWSDLLRKHGFRKSQVGLVVLDPAGKIRASVNADEPFVPASNQKLLVVCAALMELGVDFSYTTLLWSDRTPSGGVLAGDLMVTGDGDPNISGRFADGDPTALLREWSRGLRRKGIRRVTGDLLVDDFHFDQERFLPTWKKDQWSRWYSAQIGALNLNDNCVDVTVIPTAVGGLARYRISPYTAYVTVKNRCRTTRSGGLLIRLDRVRGTNEIVLSGRIPRGRQSVASAAWSGPVTIHDPGLFLGTVLKETLEEEGVVVEGKVLRDRSRLPELSRREVFHRHTSPLARDLPVILQRSQNLHSEVLLKALGAARGGGGSVEGGAQVIRGLLERLEIPAPGLEIADGSGFSPENRVAPLTLAHLLRHVSGEEFFPLFLGSLAVAGESGTLRRRLRRAPVLGRVYAKTGSIAGVSTLSGYVCRGGERDGEDAAGVEEPWIFSLLVNGFPGGRGASAAHALQEDVARRILAIAGVRQ